MQKIRPRWLPIAGTGTAQITEHNIRFEGQSKRRKTTAVTQLPPSAPYAALRSNVYFEDGDIECEMFIENPANKIQFRLGRVGESACVVGINMREHAYGVIIADGTGKPIEQNLSGAGTHPPAGKWFAFQIKVRGSTVQAYVDGIQVGIIQQTLTRAQLEVVIKGFGVMEVRNMAVAPVRPQVFVVMQFTNEFDKLYDEVIRVVCDEYGYEVVRADNVYTNGLIIDDITRSIKEASLVIADITPNNANVYYEVGYAHGINKPTILLSDRNREKLPFDISGFRLLYYDNTIGGKSAVESALRKHLDSIRA